MLAISIIALLASCKKSDKNSDTPQSKKLKYLTQVTIVQGTTTSFTNYTYDDKNRLSTMKSGDNTTTYTYNGNNLVSIEVANSSDSFRDVTAFTYANDGTISSAHETIYRNNALSSDIVYNYLVVNGWITERHHENIYVDKYTHDDKGNVTTFFSAVSNHTTTYTYDDKPNKCTNGFPNPNGYSFSPNNTISDGTVTYTYTYDTDGYPTGATLSGPPGAAAKYSYTYTER